jgi:uncharacterized protein (TIGR03435 family)
MFQALLADRFKLLVHRETKELPVYALPLANPTPNLEEAKPGNTYANGIKGFDGLPLGAARMMLGNHQLTVQGLPISSFAHLLSDALGRVVLDKTRLTAKYDFTIQWPAAVNQETISSAIGEQLGLSLEPQTALMEVLVIDHAEQPAAPQAQNTGTPAARFEAVSVIPSSTEPNQSGIPMLGLLNITQSRTRSRTRNAALIPPVFAVVSIRSVSGNLMPGMWFTTDTLNATNVTLEMLIKAAFRVEVNQISGAPNWLNSETYDIQAQLDKSVVDAMRPLSEDQRRLQQTRMLQELLADRFRLTLHREAKAFPEYDSVIAQNGPKLKEAKPGDSYPDGIKDMNGTGHVDVMRFSVGQLTGQGVSVALLVKELSRQLRASVFDKTGLKGNYDFTLQWTPDEDQLPVLERIPESSLFAALQKQLGLKLKPRESPVGLLVIDHIEKPSEN